VKAVANWRKHGVTFPEAASTFSDDFALMSGDEDIIMRKEYDFSNARPNPRARRLKRSMTIRIDNSTVEYFKAMAEETGLPYQTLINMYLTDCAVTQRTLKARWLGRGRPKERAKRVVEKKRR
jgi:predicted DNA binding CopG/RHH family protein